MRWTIALSISSRLITDEEEDDTVERQSIFLDPPSIGSTSMFGLPSPVLSSKGAERNRKMDKAGSWVWRWSEKRSDAANNTRIYCLVRGCSQKKGWALVGSSNNNVKNYHMIDHKLGKDVRKDGPYTGQTGSIQSTLEYQGKRSSAHFTTDDLERNVTKLLVRHKLPYTYVESPLLTELLHLAHAAPSTVDLKLPSNDTITRRVR